ncbi:MAG: hypothetical protein ACPL1F_01695 [bacterium]|jgi:hypothetical protein
MKINDKHIKISYNENNRIIFKGNKKEIQNFLNKLENSKIIKSLVNDLYLVQKELPNKKKIQELKKEGENKLLTLPEVNVIIRYKSIK